MDVLHAQLHGIHRYNVGEYGLTEEEVRAPFHEFIQRYDLREARR